MCVCVCVFTYMFIHQCVCVCVHTNMYVHYIRILVCIPICIAINNV